VARLGNGIGPVIFDVRVMVDGVREVVKLGEGGNTNKVWEGVETKDETECS
jgi:hypothetical protein